MGDKIDDASITAEVKSSLLSHHSTSALHTTVSTTDGVVTVGGIVGAGEDLESGAMRSLSPNPLRVRLDPLPLQKSAQSH